MSEVQHTHHACSSCRQPVINTARFCQQCGMDQTGQSQGEKPIDQLARKIAEQQDLRERQRYQEMNRPMTWAEAPGCLKAALFIGVGGFLILIIMNYLVSH